MTEALNSRSSSPTWRLLSRGLWGTVVGASLTFYLGSLPAAFSSWRAFHFQVACRIPCGPLGPIEWRALHQLGLSPEVYAGYHLVLVALLGLIPFTVGALTFLRRPDHWPTWFFSLVLAQLGFMVPPVFEAGVAAHPAWEPPVLALMAVARASILISLYLFPNGRFIPRWTRVLALGVAGMFVYMLMRPDIAGNLIYADTTYRTFSPGTLLLASGWLGTGLFAQAYRYHRVSSAAERQQTKWVLFGWLGAFLGFVGYISPYFFIPALDAPSLPRLLYFMLALPVFQLSVLLVPITTALAVLRYRLWEIDLLINRSLVYGALTAALALVFYGGILLTQFVLWAATGSNIGAPQPLPLVVVTLGTAALFSPLRRRIQVAIDRRFYRRKVDAERVLRAFALTFRQEVDLDTLVRELARHAGDATQPTFVSVWMSKEKGWLE